MRLRLSCPARIRALWRHALTVASRVAGETLTPWRAAEIIAAEAFTGRPVAASFGDRAVMAAVRLARRAHRLRRRIAAGAEPSEGNVPAPIGVVASPGSLRVGDVFAESAPVSSGAAIAPQSGVGRPANGSVDPFAVDARLVDAIGATRTSEPRIGRLLGLLVGQRLYRSFGFRNVDAYVRERIGVSTRKAWALLALERRCGGSRRSRSAIPAVASLGSGR